MASRADARAIGRGWSTAALALVVALLLPLATFLVAAWLLGWQLQSVETGSMSPTYPVGSLLVVAQVDAGAVAPGMAITFEDPTQPGRMVTHRVEVVAPGAALAFITRGDANATADSVPVPARLVRGRVLWGVTYLGTLVDWLQWPRSFVLLVVVPVLLLAWLEWHGRHGRRPSSPGNEERPEEQPDGVARFAIDSR